MKNKKITIAVMLSSLLFSCNQNENPLLNYESPKVDNYVITSGEEIRQSDISENDFTSDVIKFTYRGKSYLSKCTFGKHLLIENKSIEAIFNKLNNTPNIAIAINPDHSIEFYDSIEELDITNKLKRESITTRATLSIPYIQNFELRVWEDAKGRKKGGRFTHFYSNGTQGDRTPPPLQIPESKLKSLNLDNAISSIQMWGHLGTQLGTSLYNGQYQTASVTFYDGNFTGKSLTFNDITINKTYSERDYFSSFDFNDLTSSIEIKYF
jgi:hypothetical protein